MGLWFAIVIIVIVVTGGEVLSKAIEGFSKRRPLPPPDAGEDVRQLQDQVELLSERLDRFAQEQRFLTRLLEERPKLPDHGKSEEAD